jgi:hypothetical protein
VAGLTRFLVQLIILILLQIFIFVQIFWFPDFVTLSFSRKNPY